MNYGFFQEEFGGFISVPTVRMGDGSVGIVGTTRDADHVGVAFSEQEPGVVGEWGELGMSKTAFWKTVRVHLEFDNAESIDVVIEALERAKAKLG